MHTPVYVRSHIWHCMSELKPNHEVEGFVRRAPWQDCVSTDLETGTKTFLQHLRSPRTQKPPLFFSGRSLEPPRLFLELATRPNWANGGRGALVREVAKNPMVLLCQSSRVPLWRWENLPEGQPSLLNSANHAFMVECPDRSHSSVKGTWQSAWNLPKGT